MEDKKIYYKVEFVIQDITPKQSTVIWDKFVNHVQSIGGSLTGDIKAVSIDELLQNRTPKQSTEIWDEFVNYVQTMSSSLEGDTKTISIDGLSKETDENNT